MSFAPKKVTPGAAAAGSEVSSMRRTKIFLIAFVDVPVVLQLALLACGVLIRSRH